jgi:hypothetical protein
MTGFADHVCAGHPGDLLVPTALHESETRLRLAQQAVYKDVCVEEKRLSHAEARATDTASSRMLKKDRFSFDYYVE